jgi:endonuclease/exonuclease/phosphatase family metal-dependent hydrolase
MRRTATAALCHSGDALRVVHWNVRRCVDLTGTDSLDRVLRTVEELRPALLSLNEVDLTQTPSLLEDLSAIGLPHASFFGHVRGTYGNLLASASPLHSIEHTHLEGGSEVKTRDGGVHRIARGMLAASTSVAGVDVRVAVTHLDHMSAEQRHVQTGHLLRQLGGDEQCLVLGDLNALCRTDYTAEQWEAHAAYNQAHGWPSPCAEEACLGEMRISRFVDAYAVLEQESGWRAPPWSAHTRDPERPPYRIDYVWSRAPRTHARTPGGRRLVPLAAAIETQCGEASDHQPLVLDFEAIAFDAGE